MAETYDFLVIGSGLAGLAFALSAAEKGRVCVLTKSELQESNTSYAQGGIAAAVGESDSLELHEQDTLTAGAGLCDRDAVRFLVQSAPSAIQWLLDVGARFDHSGTSKGLANLALGREGGHSRHRIVHHADQTGWEIERAVSEAVRRHPSIVILENCFVTSLNLEGGRCVGATARLGDVGSRSFWASSTMLATGGCGRMYQHTTNPRVATADGIALATEAGAQIRNMEFMQFHPTTLYHPQMRSFLISEAARGAGGMLRNHEGTRFMYDYDPRLELAPRDVVARAIVAEMKRLQTWCVYLDLTHLPQEEIRSEFPMIYDKLKSVGLEMHKHWIPVVPAQHYCCGGVVTDLAGRTNVPGLLAAGEVACTGVHGANRLASNSLLEAIVFARSAAQEAEPGAVAPGAAHHPNGPRCIPESLAVQIRRNLQKLMMEHVGIVRSNAGLERASEGLSELDAEYDGAPDAPFSTYSVETNNLLRAARQVVDAARARKTNVGLHYNVDLDPSPTSDPA